MILYNSKERFEDCISESKYVNRCWLYLKPSLMLLKSRDTLLKIKDQMVGCSIEHNTLCLYVRLKPTNINLQECIKSLEKNNELVGESIFSKTLHKLVLKPDINIDAFIEGAYSQIYTKDQLKLCFPNDIKIRQVLMKDPQYEDEYLMFLKQCFGNSVKKEHLTEHTEYDIPPCLNQEIYNYVNKGF